MSENLKNDPVPEGEEKEMTVAESFDALEEMVRKLESEDIGLEESFRIYQEGMKLLKKVSGTIDTYEKKMQVLGADGGIGEFE